MSMIEMKSPAPHLETFTYAAEDGITFKLYLDRQTFRQLGAIADKRGCGIGGVIRDFVQNNLAKARAKASI
jgi:hypothetical protein